MFVSNVTWLLSSWECFAPLYVIVATWVSLIISKDPQVGWVTSLEMRVEKNKVQFHPNLLSHFMLGRHFTTFFVSDFHSAHIMRASYLRNQAKAKTLPLVRIEQLSDYNIAAKKIGTVLPVYKVYKPL